MPGIILARAETNIQRIVDAVRQLISGRSNAVGVVTLTANAASTTVTGQNVGEDSQVVMFPNTANAAAALATTYIPQATIVRGSFVIQHANNAQVDKTFSWMAFG